MHGIHTGQAQAQASRLDRLETLSASKSEMSNWNFNKKPKRKMRRRNIWRSKGNQNAFFRSFLFHLPLTLPWHGNRLRTDVVVSGQVYLQFREWTDSSRAEPDRRNIVAHAMKLIFSTVRKSKTCKSTIKYRWKANTCTHGRSHTRPRHPNDHTLQSTTGWCSFLCSFHFFHVVPPRLVLRMWRSSSRKTNKPYHIIKKSLKTDRKSHCDCCHFAFCAN